MQELLKHYANPEGLASSSAPSTTSHSQEPENELYRLLAPDVQALVSPYLNSRYTLTGTTRLSRRVVFNSELGASFRRWLSTWLRLLIEHHTSGGGQMPCGCARWCIRFWVHQSLLIWLLMASAGIASQARKCILPVDQGGAGKRTCIAMFSPQHGVGAPDVNGMHDWSETCDRYLQLAGCHSQHALHQFALQAKAMAHLPTGA